MITQNELRENLEYRPETGEFVWLKVNSNRVKKGQIAGTPDKDGYVQIGINRKLYAAHRLAFLYMTGAFPPYETDHINGSRSDNRWVNLRLATKMENMRNARRLGPLKKGVARNKSGFTAKIKVNRKETYLGTFKTEEEAHAAYTAAAKTYFGEFARNE